MLLCIVSNAEGIHPRKNGTGGFGIAQHCHYRVAETRSKSTCNKISTLFLRLFIASIYQSRSRLAQRITVVI